MSHPDVPESSLVEGALGVLSPEGVLAVASPSLAVLSPVAGCVRTPSPPQGISPERKCDEPPCESRLSGGPPAVPLAGAQPPGHPGVLRGPRGAPPDAPEPPGHRGVMRGPLGAQPDGLEPPGLHQLWGGPRGAPPDGSGPPGPHRLLGGSSGDPGLSKPCKHPFQTCHAGHGSWHTPFVAVEPPQLLLVCPPTLLLSFALDLVGKLSPLCEHQLLDLPGRAVVSFEFLDAAKVLAGCRISFVAAGSIILSTGSLEKDNQVNADVGVPQGAPLNIREVHLSRLGPPKLNQDAFAPADPPLAQPSPTSVLAWLPSIPIPPSHPKKRPRIGDVPGCPKRPCVPPHARTPLEGVGGHMRMPTLPQLWSQCKPAPTPPTGLPTPPPPQGPPGTILTPSVLYYEGESAKGKEKKHAPSVQGPPEPTCPPEEPASPIAHAPPPLSAAPSRLLETASPHQLAFPSTAGGSAAHVFLNIY